MTTKRGLFTYENGLLLILGLSFGIAFFDRNAAAVLNPYITHDLQLTNTQTAFISSGLAITWALGAFFIARLSDQMGSRKAFLLAFLVIFSACSILSGLASSYPVLLISRMIMGAVEGPFLPVCLAIMAVESSEHRRGFNAGFMQNFFAALLGQSVAPLVLVPIAEAFGWRTAFFVAGVPGLLCAVAVAVWVREPSKEAQNAVGSASLGAHGATSASAYGATSADTQGALAAGATTINAAAPLSLLGMLKVRNIALCCAISVFMVAWMIIGWTFFPRYFTDVRGLPGPTMGYLLTVLGIASALSGFGGPLISDRIGRKPIMITFCLAGVLTPLAVLYFQGSLVVLGLLMFIGWMGTGAFPLFMGVIPGETIPRRMAATAMGLVVCVGEVIGGFGITSLAGKLADDTSIVTPLLMQVVCAAIGGTLCFFLLETAPAKVRALSVAAAARPA